MSRGRRSQPHRTVVLIALVLFAFWQPLFAGGTLSPDDQLWGTAPFIDDAPEGLAIETAERDAAAIHGQWTRWADDVRAGEGGWWQSAGDGRPFFADGLPVTHLAYLLVPAWYAPGLVAALAVFLAATGAMRLADRRGASAVGGLSAGVVFGFSGLMWVWVGWPHATAIALAPWIAAAAVQSRREPSRQPLIMLALATAASAWAGVFAITAYSLIAAAALVVGDASTERSRAGLGRVALGGAAGLGLAAPHLWSAWSRWTWADTSAREAVGDTSADLIGVVTAAFGSALGDNSKAIAWAAGSSQQLTVGFVGLVTILTAALALFGARHGGRRRGPVALVVAGVALAYVGGPFTPLADLVAGSASEMTHARVLVVLGLALLAAEGVDLVARSTPVPSWRDGVASSRSRATIALGVVVVAATAIGWLRVVVDAEILRAVVSQSLGGLLAAAVAIGLFMGWRRGAVPASIVALGAVALTAFELLSFGVAIPTVTDRDDRLEATEAHEFLADLVGPHGRVSGENATFAPVTAARFDIADVRAPGLRSTGEIALFAAADPASVLAASGGGPEAPVLRIPSPDVDPSRDRAWDLLGVDAWVLPGDATPPGRFRPPPAGDRVEWDGSELEGSIDVPDEGVRAVVIDLVAPIFSTIHLRLAVGDVVVDNTVLLRQPTDGETAIAIAGEDLPAGEATVVFTIDSRDLPAEIGVADGGVRTGVVEGGPDRDLVWTEGALVFHRPTPRAIWVESDDQATIETIAETDGSVAVRVDADGPGTVRFDIVDEPGWTVAVDGTEIDHRAVDGTVIAVDVDEGAHDIELRYRPPRLIAGLVTAAAALVVLAVAAARSSAPGSPGRAGSAGSVSPRE